MAPVLRKKRSRDMKKKSTQIGLGIALGAGLGAALSVALGTGSAWLALGIAVGIVIGAAITRTSSHKTRSTNNDQRLTTND
jgi:predicted MFS family arabinose efflux permease